MAKVCGSPNVHEIIEVAFDQINVLLGEGHIDEALELAHLLSFSCDIEDESKDDSIARCYETCDVQLKLDCE